MDRLLCGDVGFGKTEVALRAAMKCILSGKQCAILVPTTVLAMQHYQTAVRRFEAFPVHVELLSRFRTTKQQKETLERMKKGTADLVIGTHRIVQKDVQFRNLGLAIVDEEQRFGVGHKEKFKEMFPGVDMLTLSATPIPRTLNMAMSGIRDMSVISEPPQDRHPVQTYVMEYQFGVVVQALQREMRRGGQAYYIHNRVETISYTAAKLQEALPEARIGVAHGQMTEAELSEIWRKLVECEIDILVCTTIIETGVDVANVNTLIIEQADCFGLSQLYQLRGRVGRSSRRAYAYFTFRRDKALSEVSTKRLAAMREFTQFGSGFQIAMRDLEIRGAGSILSGKQHGHMEAVGYDMYLRLLSEAVAEERGEPVQAVAECVVDVQISAHIPEDYIRSMRQRLSIYRKIAAVQTQEDQLDLQDELIDRFGDPPQEILGLIAVSLLRNRAAKLGISEVNQRGERLYFYITSPTPEQVTALASAFRGRILFHSLKKPYLAVTLQKGDTPISLMQQVLTVMESAF
jgi:transcription-repair coupling factor (superfamily II helicase)